MERVSLILLIIFHLIFVPKSIGQEQIENYDLITVDVTDNYSSQKELLIQDFMDVEYVPLETNEEFINQGVVLDITKKYILVKNENRINDGNIFLYDRTGKAIRKINRKGQGGEEYISLYGAILDEANEEMFINDILGRKVLVYDLYGVFKRSFRNVNSGDIRFYTHIFNYDRHHLICYDEFHKETPFVLISKQDGKVVRKIQIPFKEKKFLGQIREGGSGNQSVVGVGPGSYYSMFPFNENWILSELSSDIVYYFPTDFSLRPFIKKTPSIQSLKPEIFMVIRLLSERYYFMETIKNVYDWDSKEGFPRNFFVYDTKEQSFSRYKVYNGDFTTKQEIYINHTEPVNHEIGAWYPLEAYQLVESYEKGELKGELKEIASKLDEDSNPVIMLLKHKK